MQMTRDEMNALLTPVNGVSNQVREMVLAHFAVADARIDELLAHSNDVLMRARAAEADAKAARDGIIALLRVTVLLVTPFNKD